MKKYKNVIITIALILCGFLAWRYYEDQKMLHLHHTYEVSLAKALKNSYKDIEGIHFKNPVYSDKPGSWSVSAELIFKDGEKIAYGISHLLTDTDATNGIIESGDLEKSKNYLEKHYGITKNKIKVYYSNKTMEDR